VAERLQALAGFALFTAQPHSAARYYGSGHVVRHAAQAAGQPAEVRVSDRDPDARHDLGASGLTALQHPGFDPADGFSILAADVDADLALIDPYGLCAVAPAVLPSIATASQRMAIVATVLLEDPMDEDARRYTALKASHLAGAWALHCPRLEGESLHAFEILLAAPRLFAQPEAAALRERLERYARRLSEMFAATVQLSEV
jgi:hypothetical protein